MEIIERNECVILKQYLGSRPYKGYWQFWTFFWICNKNLNIEIEILWYQTNLFYFGTLNVELSLSWLATKLIYNQIDCAITSFSTFKCSSFNEFKMKFRGASIEISSFMKVLQVTILSLERIFTISLFVLWIFFLHGLRDSN